MGFFKDSSDIKLDDLELELSQDEVLVFQELDKKRVNEQNTTKIGEQLPNLQQIQEMDEIDEFLALSRKRKTEKLTRAEKKRYKKLIRFIDGQKTTLKEIVRDWVGLAIIIGATTYYLSLPYKIYEYNQSVQNGTNEEFITTETLINEEYDKLHQNEVETELKQFAKVLISKLNVRSEPNETSEKLGQLEKNEEVEFLTKVPETDFVKVLYNGEEGFIHQDFVEIINKSVEKE